MNISASKLRGDIYNLLDEVIATGVPLEVARKGHVLTVAPKRKGKKLDRLVKHDVVVGDPEDLVEIDWSKEWSGDLP